MIKCDLGNGIEIKGFTSQLAVEFEHIATTIREAFEKELGEEDGREFFEECIKNSKMSEAERLKAAEDAEKEMSPEDIENAKVLFEKILGEVE